MLNMSFFIDVDDVQDVLDSLDTAHSPVALAAFFQGVIGPYLQERAKARFRNEGDDVSGPWAPLSSTTEAFRESGGFPPDHPINHRTGRLEYYITGTKVGAAPTSTGGALLTFPANPPRGATAEKVKTAQYGKLRPNTPPRPVLGINEKDIAFTTMALHHYIETAARGKLSP